MNTTREVGEQVAPLANSASSISSLTVRGANGVACWRRFGQFLSQPGHGAVEVVQGETVGVRDVVVVHPRRAVAVGAGDEEAVQDGGEHRPLEGKLKGATGKQFVITAWSRSSPTAARTGAAADAPGREAGGLGIRLESRQEHDLIAQARAGGQQGSEATTGGEFISAPDGGNDMLAHAPFSRRFSTICR